jgi:benzil reductase ((S)-benzoin forming)
MTDLTILTGSSRGMGLAMAQQLLRRGSSVLAIARHRNESLTALAKETGASLEQWQFDLADSHRLPERLAEWFAQQSASSYSSATLINNAATIAAIGPLREAQPADLAMAMRVGLEAPMQLTAAFLAATADWQTPRKVLNISSGLARRAMASQAPYCAAKAGMDHFTRCVALEEGLLKNGAKLCSLAPGVIATDMQGQLRSASVQDFPDVGNFIAMHDKGMLQTSEQAAEKVLAFLARSDFGENPVADIRD